MKTATPAFHDTFGVALGVTLGGAATADGGATGAGPSSSSTPPLFRFTASRAPNTSLRPVAGRRSKKRKSPSSPTRVQRKTILAGALGFRDLVEALDSGAARAGPASTPTPPLFRFSASRAPNMSLRPVARRKNKKRESPPRKATKAGAFGFRELLEALNGGGGGATGAGQQQRRPLTTIADVPHDVLVSIFEAVGDPRWVRLTVPRVCKEWNELYLSESASPLHETLEVDFYREGASRRGPVEGAPPRLPVVDASRVLSWARRRAGWVRKPHLEAGGFDGALEDFSAEDLGALVAVVGPSLAEISVQDGLDELCERPFWRSLRTSVVPFGRLRSLVVVEDWISVLNESDVEPLGQLAGSLEELELTAASNDDLDEGEETGLPRFPEPFFALTKLRRLVLAGHPQITAIPAGISSLKNLEELELRHCRLSSLPKELGELSGLTQLNLHDNEDLGSMMPADEAFPVELKKLKSLRDLDLSWCGLRTVPSFVGELKSLDDLNFHNNHLSSLPKELGELSGLTKLVLEGNRDLGTSPQEPGRLSRLTRLILPASWRLGSTPNADEAFPAELGKMKSLRYLDLKNCGLRTVPAFVGELKSLEDLDLAFNSKLQIDAPLDFLIEGCPRLRIIQMYRLRWNPWTPESLDHLYTFKAKLLAKNPDAWVSFFYTK